MKRNKVFLKEKNSQLDLTPSQESVKKIRKNNLTEVIVGLRPQNICWGNVTNKHASFKGIIDIVEFLGENAHVVVKTGNTKISVFCNAKLNLRKQNIIKLFYDPKKLHIFHPKNEKSIEFI